MQWHFAPFRLDLDNACLWRGVQRVTLRPKPFDILVYLVEHAGALVTKEALLEAVWPDTAVAEGVLATSMVELRKALGETAREPQFIATVHRRGYRFIAPVVAEDPLEPLAMPPDALEVSSPPSTHALQGSTLPRPGRVDQMVRRLAAILSADVQGYSRLMGEDEAATLQTLTTYRALMTAHIAQHRGRVVDAPGDNLLAEFASVVDAVQCAVAMQRELAERNRALPTHRQMWFRMGINLGDVLVEGDQIYGDGVNLAARLEGLAEGGGICVSGPAFDQIENKLDLIYTDLGEQSVKNIVKPVRVYRVQPAATPGASSALGASPLAWDPAGSRGVRHPRYLVSREAELAALHACLAHALQGDRQVVFITGEAGIGKTTLVDAFVAQMARPLVPWVGRGQCIEQYGAGEAYLPLLEAFGGLCRGPEGAHLLTRLTQQAPSWLLQMPALLSPAEYDTLQRRVAGATRERMLRELAEAVETLSTERPLVLVLEDLHWSDASTLEWLAYVARRRQPARLLVLGTYRPSDAIVREHPVRVVTQELLVHGQCQQVVVGYLTEAQVEAYLTLRFGTGPLSATLAPLLQQRTNGNALFLVTRVEEMVRQGVLHAGPAGWEVAAGADVVTLEAPESIRHLLTRQLEQLPREAQALLEAASVMGKAFTVAPVAAAVDRPPEEVEEQCAALARWGQWLRAHGPETWPDGTVTARFAFLHDLYRGTAYGQVPMSRQARWHQQIGLRLEHGYGAQAREMAAELAEHFVQGRDAWRAVQYLRYAGENAMKRSAHEEAIAHLRRGLERLAMLPDTPQRLQQELTLHLVLGPALGVTRGYAAPEVEQTYVRAQALCQQHGESLQSLPVVQGLWSVYHERLQFRQARDLGEQCLAMARQGHDPVALVEAHRALGSSLFYLGELPTARWHFEQGITHYNLQRERFWDFRTGDDLGVVCLAFLVSTLGFLGYPDQAQQRATEARHLAQELRHPYSLAFAQYRAGLHALFYREAQAAQRLAEEVLSVATAHGFPFYEALGTALKGGALVRQGQGEVGLALLRQGLTALHHTGTQPAPHWLVWQAELYGYAGQPAAGLRLLEQARVQADTTGNVHAVAELYRLQGEFFLALSAERVAEAEASFRQALAVARRQQAKVLELRAAMSLARLWQQQGKGETARHLLAEVYGWFSEGFETADLQEAKTILEELAAY